MEIEKLESLKISLKKDFVNLMKEIDNRNISYVESGMHDAYHDSIVFKGKPGAISSSKANYLHFLSEGKLGGVERKVTVLSLEILDQFGIVRARLESEVMKFDGLFTFYLDGNKWLLIKAIIVAEKKEI